MPNAIDTSRHSCECICAHCNLNKTGLFAQLAALSGDSSAAAIFGQPLARFLFLQSTRRRAQRLPRRKRKSP